jgi:hypothetical protein
VTHPGREGPVSLHPRVGRGRGLRQHAEGRRLEVAGNPIDLLLRQLRGGLAHRGPLLVDQTRELVGAGLVDRDLDAGLVLVVAAAELVVDPQDRLEVREQIVLRQEGANRLADDRACGP